MWCFARKRHLNLTNANIIHLWHGLIRRGANISTSQPFFSRDAMKSLRKVFLHALDRQILFLTELFCSWFKLVPLRAVDILVWNENDSLLNTKQTIKQTSRHFYWRPRIRSMVNRLRLAPVVELCLSRDFNVTPGESISSDEASSVSTTCRRFVLASKVCSRQTSLIFERSPKFAKVPPSIAIIFPLPSSSNLHACSSDATLTSAVTSIAFRFLPDVTGSSWSRGDMTTPGQELTSSAFDIDLTMVTELDDRSSTSQSMSQFSSDVCRFSRWARLSSSCWRFRIRLSSRMRSSSSGIGTPLHVRPGCSRACWAGRPGPFLVFSRFLHLARRFWNHTCEEWTGPVQ